jgi:hypothetical protein
MTSSSEHSISKWWLKGLALLASASPPALLIWFQDALLPYIAELPQLAVLRVVAALLLTSLSLLAFLLLQRPWLTWEEPTGTWVNRMNGLHYCGTCRAKKLFVPLKNEVTGWRCVACTTFRPDPKRKPKGPPQPPTPSGTNAWMA